MSERDQAKKAARHRIWRQQNPARMKAIRDRWNEAHPNRPRGNTLAWFHKHPGMRTVYNSRRRARVLGNGGRHSLVEWRDKCALLGNVCVYCGEDKPLIRDHKNPLSRGGTDNISNIVPACWSCNARKRDKTAQEFITQRICA